MTQLMKESIQKNQAIRAIEAGLLGPGKLISVVSGDTLRFTRALALGNGEFPSYQVIKEEDLGKVSEDGSFLVEVLLPLEPLKDIEIDRLLESAVKGGFYIQAFNKSKEVGSFEDLVWYFHEDFLFNTNKSFPEKDTHIEVNGRLTSDGCLMFEKEITYQEMYSEHEEVTVVYDGYVYSYDTQVSINDDMSVYLSHTPTREMNQDEWDCVKSQPSNVKFIHQAM